MSFFENTRKPVGFGGKIMVAMMNLGHSAVARWGLQFLNAAPDAKVLDCGCAVSYTHLDYAYYVLSDAPSYYKEATVNADGSLSFGKTVGTATELSDVTPKFRTESRYGDYQLNLDGLENTIAVDQDQVYGVIAVSYTHLSVGRVSTFLDIYIERDIEKGILTEKEAQELIDHLVMKFRMVKFARIPSYNQLFSGDPVWATLEVAGMGIDVYKRQR